METTQVSVDVLSQLVSQGPLVAAMAAAIWWFARRQERAEKARTELDERMLAMVEQLVAVTTRNNDVIARNTGALERLEKRQANAKGESPALVPSPASER